METKATRQQVIDLLPKQVSLTYVDYRSDLSDHLDVIQECIEQGEWCPLDEKIFDWFDESRWEGVRYVMDELRDDIEREFDLDEDEAQELMDEYEDWIRDEIYERDDSDTISDLFRNTPDESVFYDTGIYVESESWSWSEAQIRLERMRIKHELGIMSHSKDDDDIDMMLRQASYGGRLVIYFLSDMKELIVIDPKFNAVKFRNPVIAVINNGNGSGDHCELTGGVTVTMPLERSRFFIDKTTSYSYVHEVCGMVRDWCDSTVMEFTTIEEVPELPESSMAARRKREAELDKVFKAGGCTPGDMKFTRHRNTTYVNDFPCGNRCTKCGTFWID